MSFMECLERFGGKYENWLNFIGLAVSIACAFLIGAAFQDNPEVGCTMGVILFAVVCGLVAAAGARKRVSEDGEERGNGQV